jgi:hypothetical protein
MIKRINIQRLRNAGFVQFFKHLISIAEKFDIQALQISEEFAKLKESFAELTEVFKLPLGSVITKEMREFDRQRDNLVTGIQSVIRGLVHSPEAEISKQAAVLAAHLEVFGSRIQDEAYHDETAIINKIIADWKEQPELAAALTSLNLDSWKKALETANNNFEESYLNRSEENSTVSREKMAAKRLQATDAYYEFRDRLNAFHLITKGAPAYASVIEFINEVVDDANTALSKRLGSTDEVTATEANDASEVK